MLEQKEKSLILNPEINYPTDKTPPLLWSTQSCKPSQEEKTSSLGNVHFWNPKRVLVETQKRAVDHHAACDDLSYLTGMGWESN